MAFNRPNKGRIVVDGKDLNDIPLRDYREQLASVLQENFLFDGTIADEHRLREARVRRSTRSSAPRRSRTAKSSSSSSPKATTRSSASAASS